MHHVARWESIYVLAGHLLLTAAGSSAELSADDFALVPVGVSHSLANRSAEIARWYELATPRAPTGFEDTVLARP